MKLWIIHARNCNKSLGSLGTYMRTIGTYLRSLGTYMRTSFPYIHINIHINRGVEPLGGFVLQTKERKDYEI